MVFVGRDELGETNFNSMSIAAQEGLELITFPPYTMDELVQIVQSRLAGTEVCKRPCFGVLGLCTPRLSSLAHPPTHTKQVMSDEAIRHCTSQALDRTSLRLLNARGKHERPSPIQFILQVARDSAKQKLLLASDGSLSGGYLLMENELDAAVELWVCPYPLFPSPPTPCR